ncbi:putative DNA primase/helicase [Rhodovulum steppense]|uniref:Putative DNA primase/helicase n=2 Tax=Rhodovulum steppense TaxID=540251 RepID=A0A4V2R3Q7_9RHOB|nr:putative DNA primase/helicase [Rhodovulum steppense]
MKTTEKQQIATLLGFHGVSLLEEIAFSRGQSETSARVRRQVLPLAAFKALLLDHTEGPKAGPCWMPATFTGNRRSGAAAEAVQVAVLDLDSGQPVDEIAELVRAAGLAAILHTSHSHRPEHPKVRVILFPARPWRAADYANTGTAARAYRAGLANLAEVLGLAADPAAMDPARLFFLPRHAPGADFSAEWIDGGAAEVWPEPGAAPAIGEVLPALAGEGEVPPEVLFSALAAIRNDSRFGRHEWVKTIAAVRNALGEEGREAAEAWSAEWSEGDHDPDEFARVWESIHDPRASAGTIFMYARRDGWSDPRAEAERERLLAAFDDLPTDEEEAELAERAAADRLAEFGDIANGAAHADRIRGTRRYVSATRQWLVWTGARWAAQTAEETMRDAKATSAAMVSRVAREARRDPGGLAKGRMAKAMALHGSAAALARMVEMAQSERGMHGASPAEFDANPLDLTCRNGILDLRTGLLRQARPHDLVSKLAGAAFEPAARAPVWERFLETVIPDSEVRAFVQRAVGYTLTGSVDEEVFFLAHGTGANGKSVFANVIAAMLGEFSGSFGAALVTRQKHENEAHRMVARLPGLRLALVNETGVGDLWDSGRMKELASRERMSARLLHKEAFDFMPTAKLWIRTNHLPGSLDAGDGFWRRCVPIPFTTQIAAESRVPDLDRQIIAAELSGVLNWAVAGAVAWARGGLQVPRSIRGEVETYREETDLLGQWIAERTQRDPQSRVPVAEAFRDYEEFCRSLGANAGTAMTFSRAMSSRGVNRDPSRKQGRRFMGFRLRERLRQEDFDDDADDFSRLI